MRTTIKQQLGTSIIEVMVSLFVLAIGILGILAMQAKSMQYNQSAHVYSQAIYLASDLAERVRSNPTNAAAYVTNVPASGSTAPSPDCTQVACTGAELVNWDLWAWSQRLYGNLPEGAAEITQVPFSGRNYLNIELNFDDSRAEEDQPDANRTGRKTYRLLVEI